MFCVKIIIGDYMENENFNEEINISNFTTDIDFMLLNPSAISQDGFALFAAVTPQGGGQLELPFTRQTVDGVEYYIQNGYLAYINLQPTYWVYDMPARLFKINDTQYQAASIERKKKQTLSRNYRLRATRS